MLRLHKQILSISVILLGTIAVVGNLTAQNNAAVAAPIAPSAVDADVVLTPSISLPVQDDSVPAVDVPVPTHKPVVTPRSKPSATPVATPSLSAVENTVGLSSHDVVTNTPAAEAQKKKSGVNGRIMIDGGCPVVEIHVDDTATTRDCAMKPFQSIIAIINVDTHEYLGEFASNPQGHFKVDLEPGNYLIKENVDYFIRPMTSMQPVTFTVVAGEYTDVTVNYDSGVR